MIRFPKDIQFKYPWRDYQQRVLDELQEHLSDKHLHVIAPPGSGKTVLGLEVALRLNQPVLILAPTLAIRNQWIQRFCELFLQIRNSPDWISSDIRNPKFMTVVTYQGLHAACYKLKNEKETEEESEEAGQDTSLNTNFERIVSGLRAQHIKTIVVDEAHHLKNEWWQTLSRIKEKLDPVIVGLTATPPYDVSATEWQRYIELNGPVDTEISVPELIIEGDLCPHQDYVYFTLPTTAENQSITAFRQNTATLFQELKHDHTLLEAIEAHPVWQDPTSHLDWIYHYLPCYSACLIFLNANGKEIPQTHLDVVGDKRLNIPPLNYEWMEILLDFYLYKEKTHFAAFELHRKTLENRLKRYGAIERRQISFSRHKGLTDALTSSVSKLSGIKEIVEFEYRKLQQDLRLVILTDFIRKEFFVNSNVNTHELNKIGVLPIFEKLRREIAAPLKMGVLTGSMVILPLSAYARFEAKAAGYGITRLHASLVPFDKNYILIHPQEQLNRHIVHLVTQLFQRGEIEVLIGTKSLLGEGWDAPALNALILASFVGSFVLSNQMRGRAIRTENGNPYKTSNIWHLVCVDPTDPAGGDDLALLKRRFRSFVGVSFREEPAIESGIGRLNLPKTLCEREEIEKKNREMFAYAGDRESLSERWEKALATGVTLVEEIKIPFLEARSYQATKSLYLQKTIAYLMATVSSAWLAFGLAGMELLGKSARTIRTSSELYVFLAFIGVVGVLLLGGMTYKAFRLYIRYRDISKDIQQIGDVLLSGLLKAGLIHTNASLLKVEASIDNEGAIFCHLEGGTTVEKSTFIHALQEIVAPVGNPRYVIIRKNRFFLFSDQKDYHAVPERLGRNKNLAEHFKQQWEQVVGDCELVFTRTIEGRKLLLQARVKSLAAQFEDRVEHVNKWK